MQDIVASIKKRRRAADLVIGGTTMNRDMSQRGSKAARASRVSGVSPSHGRSQVVDVQPGRPCRFDTISATLH